jgi:hypothetical protein
MVSAACQSIACFAGLTGAPTATTGTFGGRAPSRPKAQERPRAGIYFDGARVWPTRGGFTVSPLGERGVSHSGSIPPLPLGAAMNMPRGATPKQGLTPQPTAPRSGFVWPALARGIVVKGGPRGVADRGGYCGYAPNAVDEGHPFV